MPDGGPPWWVFIPQQRINDSQLKGYELFVASEGIYVKYFPFTEEDIVIFSWDNPDRRTQK